MKKFHLLLIVAAGSALFVYESGFLGSSDKPEVTQEMPASTAAVERHGNQSPVQMNGEVQPVSQTEVKTELDGRLKKIHVLPGMQVTKGMLLMEIDDHEILSELELAKIEFDGARLSMEKARKNQDLYSELVVAQDNLAKSQQKKQLMENKLSKTKVIAPCDGTVLTLPVVEGQAVISANDVQNATTLMTIGNLTHLTVTAHVNEIDAGKLSLKQEVALTAESIRNKEMNAVITFIAPGATVRNAMKGFLVKAIIDTPPPELLPGMAVQMSVSDR